MHCSHQKYTLTLYIPSAYKHKQINQSNQLEAISYFTLIAHRHTFQNEKFLQSSGNSIYLFICVFFSRILLYFIDIKHKSGKFFTTHMDTMDNIAVGTCIAFTSGFLYGSSRWARPHLLSCLLYDR